LWFRLNVFPIFIPPLRHRKEDIPALVHYFVERKSKEFGFQSAPTLAFGAMDQLVTYHWPGNVRELENVVERAIILNPTGPVSFEQLASTPNGNAPYQQPPVEPLQMDESLDLDDATAKHIKRVLRITGGKIYGPGGAAELMGINPNTLRGRMRKLNIPYGRKANGS
jgi:hydrogenase-4 transcriptional activator